MMLPLSLSRVASAEHVRLFCLISVARVGGWSWRGEPLISRAFGDRKNRSERMDQKELCLFSGRHVSLTSCHIPSKSSLEMR